MQGLSIQYENPRDLGVRPSNPRTHTSRQIKQIAESICEFGFVNPVLVDGSKNIIAGHARTVAAISLGMSAVPTVCVDHLSPAQVRSYVIADNRLAEKAGWDRSLLALELRELSVELNFDVTITGFETAEIDILIGEETNGGILDEVDDLPVVCREMPAVSCVGDLWQLGNHRLLCGDARNPNDYRTLLQSSYAQLVFIDPPYNVRINGHVSGLGQIKHREFSMASGEMSRDDFAAFLKRTLSNLSDFSADGSIHFICMDWRHLQELLEAADGIYSELKNVCVWAKNNAGMGSLYRSAHEFVFVYKNGTGQHINNVELGRFGRNRTNVWHYPSASSFGKGRDDALAMHPTVKPLAMVRDAILDCSKRGGLVLDAFAGSGTTLFACEKSGRRGFGIELDPYYVDLAIQRFEKVYGLSATHVKSGLNFGQMKAERTG